ncbi:transposase [candidate division KSB1 bacterium]|nr:transposase [candidate division KSB1 bacterium]
MRKTKFAAGCYYHILNRGNEKKTIFFERDNYLFFLRRLKQGSEKLGPEVLCYCLMPNHFHLILQEVSEKGISDLMLSLQTSYAKAINKRYNRVGHLFQGPFKNILVDKNEYLLHLSRYIHINPVIAGWMPNPEDWEFSSFRDFVGLRAGTLPQPKIILSQFSDKGTYWKFVNDYKDDSNIQGYTLE